MYLSSSIFFFNEAGLSSCMLYVRLEICDILLCEETDHFLPHGGKRWAWLVLMVCLTCLFVIQHGQVNKFDGTIRCFSSFNKNDLIYFFLYVLVF